MSKHEIEFRLSGTGLPDGEIGMDGLAGIAGTLQELATRIGRFSIDQVGPGPTKSSVEAVTRLRLTGLSDGSTRLHIAYGHRMCSPSMSVSKMERRPCFSRSSRLCRAVTDRAGSPSRWLRAP